MERVKRALPAEPEIISPARAKLMDEEQDRAGARETNGIWRATVDGRTYGDSRGYRTRSEAMAEAEHMVRQDEIAKRVRAEQKAQADAKRATPESDDDTPVVRGAATAGFTVESKRPKWKKENAPLTDDERKEFHDAGWTDDELGGYTPDEARAKLGEEHRPIVEIDGVSVRPLRTTDAATAIKENYRQGDYARGAPRIMDRLRDLIVKIAGHVTVHYINSEDMERITGDPSRGAYNHDLGVILLNVDNMLPSTPMHEAYHAVIAIGLRKEPQLRDLMERVRVEVLKNLPAMSKEDRKAIGYYLSQHEEFINGMMTNPLVQELLKGVKISAQLAKDLGIPLWRKMTSWEGMLSLVRRAINAAIGKDVLGPRETSALEAAMALSEKAIWHDPRAAGDLMEAAGRMAMSEMKGEKWWKQDSPDREGVERRIARMSDEQWDKLLEKYPKYLYDPESIPDKVVEKIRKEFPELFEGPTDEDVLSAAGFTEDQIKKIMTGTAEEIKQAVDDAHASINESLVGPDEYLKAPPEPELGPEQPGDVTTTDRDGKPFRFRPPQLLDAAGLLARHYYPEDYTSVPRAMMDRCAMRCSRSRTDVKVYIMSDRDMRRVFRDAMGVYDNNDGWIGINGEGFTNDTSIHEVFHGATNIAIRSNPDIQRVMTKLHREAKEWLAAQKGIPKDIRKETAYFFTNPTEFLTGLMTNPAMQKLLKGMPISRKLAREINMPQWRKLTMWNGIVEAIRQLYEKFGLGKRDTSAIEAAMAISEYAMIQDPRGAALAMQASGRLHTWKLAKAAKRAMTAPSREGSVLARVRTRWRSLKAGMLWSAL